MKLRFWLLPLVLLARPVSAESWKLLPPGNGSTTIEITLPYSLGTHHGKITRVEGEVTLEKGELKAGTIRVPIEALDMGKPKLNCHTREALGLDYSKSEYPKDHVCDSDNRIPLDGPNAVAYPSIEFSWPVTKFPKLAEKQLPVALKLSGIWTIHGVSHPATLDLTISEGDWKENLDVTLETNFLLADYGIAVKPFLFVRAGEKAHVKMKLRFARS